MEELEKIIGKKDKPYPWNERTRPYDPMNPWQPQFPSYPYEPTLFKFTDSNSLLPPSVGDVDYSVSYDTIITGEMNPDQWGPNLKLVK